MALKLKNDGKFITPRGDLKITVDNKFQMKCVSSKDQNCGILSFLDSQLITVYELMLILRLWI